MYKKLVILFKSLKYIVTSAVFTSILSFNDCNIFVKHAIKKILKGQIPCQAVK